MNFNFDNLQARTKNGKNNKTFSNGTRTKNFELKYSLGDSGKSKFVVSLKLWDKLGLDEGNGLMFAQVADNTGRKAVVVGLVKEDDNRCSLFPKSKSKKEGGTKTKSTHSKNLESDLLEVGALREVDQESITKGRPHVQFLKLEEITGQNLPEGVEKMFEIVAASSEDASNDSEESSEEAGETVEDSSTDEATDSSEENQEEEEVSEVEVEEEPSSVTESASQSLDDEF